MPKPKRKRRTNRQLLIDRLFQGHVQRTGAFVSDKAITVAEKRKAVETSHLQSMAAFLSEELECLSRGNGECKKHPGLVDGACPRCNRIWPGE